MLAELLDCGFDTVELGHGIRVSLMPGIQKMYDDGRVRFSSLHNFCPLPVEITRASPDCLQFTGHREQERERAVKQTLQTIDFAVRLGAPYVVLHCGRVPMEPITSRLIRLASEGRHLSPEYARLKLRAVQHREKFAPTYIARLKDCLKRIVEYAGEKGIRLGLESRQAYEEVPSPRDFAGLMEEFSAPTVNYWHDFGHVQLKHNLGLLDHYEWLERIAPQIIGGHVHDVEWPARDHRVPFSGTLDYAAILRYFPPGCPLVWELSPTREADDIREALAVWREKFPDRLPQ